MAATFQEIQKTILEKVRSGEWDFLTVLAAVGSVAGEHSAFFEAVDHPTISRRWAVVAEAIEQTVGFVEPYVP